MLQTRLEGGALIHSTGRVSSPSTVNLEKALLLPASAVMWTEGVDSGGASNTAGFC